MEFPFLQVRFFNFKRVLSPGLKLIVVIQRCPTCDLHNSLHLWFYYQRELRKLHCVSFFWSVKFEQSSLYQALILGFFPISCVLIVEWWLYLLAETLQSNLALFANNASCLGHGSQCGNQDDGCDKLCSRSSVSSQSSDQVDFMTTNLTSGTFLS